MQRLLGVTDAFLYFLYQWSSPLLDLHTGHKQQKVLIVFATCEASASQGLARGQEPAKTFLPGPSILWGHLLQEVIALSCILGWAVAGCQISGFLPLLLLSHSFPLCFQCCAQQPVRYKDEQPLWDFLYIFCTFSLCCGSWSAWDSQFPWTAKDLRAVQWLDPDAGSPDIHPLHQALQPMYSFWRRVPTKKFSVI